MSSATSSADTVTTVRSHRSHNEPHSWHSETISEDIVSHPSAVTYSDDFESTRTQSRSKPLKAIHTLQNSDNYEKALPVSGHTTARSIHSEQAVYSDDFDDPSIESKIQSWTSYPVRHRSTSSLGYSEDFESESSIAEDISIAALTARSVPVPTPRKLHSFTSYSEDFESSFTHSKTPVKTPRRSLSRESAVSESSSVLYSESWESMTGSQTVPSYTQSFETITQSDDDTVNQASVINKPRLSVQETDDSDTESNLYSYTETFESVAETPRWSPDAEKELVSFLTAKLQTMRNELPVQTRVAPTKRPESQDLYDKQDSEALKKFCQAMIEKTSQTSRIKKDEKKKPCKPSTDASLWTHLRGIDPNSPVELHGISPFIINKLRMRNTMARLERDAKENFHEPRKCPQCRQKLEENARKDFLMAKLHLVNETCINEKLEAENIRCNDRVGLMGDVLTGLPSLRDPPQDIMSRLLRPVTDQHTAGDPLDPDPEGAVRRSADPYSTEAAESGDTEGKLAAAINCLQKDSADNVANSNIASIGVAGCTRGITRENRPQTGDGVTLMDGTQFILEPPEALKLQALPQEQFWKLYFSRLKDGAVKS